MKLYTEEQVLRAIQMADKYRYLIADEEPAILSLLTPIELPTENEILMHSYPHKSKGFIARDITFIEGAKWVIEQIKKQK